MAEKKKFQDLNLNNAFLFAAVSQDEEMCRLIIEIILDRPVSNITVNAEDTILYSSDYKGIRLDAHAHAVLEVKCNLNIEMQNKNEKNIPRRSRYNQGVLDISSLKPGEKYNDLETCYVIYICNFDPGGRGFYRYTAKMIYEETGEPIDDGAMRIFLNTGGENQKDVSNELIYFLGYINNSTWEYVNSAGCKKLTKLHSQVEKLKKDRRLEEKYMRVQDLLDIEYLKGQEHGFINGEKNGYMKGDMSRAQITAKNMYQRGYSAEDTAGLLELQVNTIRQWFKDWE